MTPVERADRIVHNLKRVRAITTLAEAGATDQDDAELMGALVELVGIVTEVLGSVARDAEELRTELRAKEGRPQRRARVPITMRSAPLPRALPEAR